MFRAIGNLQGKDRTRLVVFLSLVAAFFSVASVAEANTVSMTFIGGAPGNTTTLNVTDATATPSYTGVTALIDPYVADVAGSPTLIWCVDPDHEVNTGDSWTAYLSLPGDVTHTYLSSATTYGEMAYLVTQLQATDSLPPSSTRTTTEQELQAAIWDIAEGATSSNGYTTDGFTVNGMSSGFYSAVDSDIKSADNNPLNSGYEILTDKAGKEQEFLVLVPEPSSLLLLGVGLFAFMLLSRSKMARPLIG